ncbi:hypothetical protein E2C01_022910 [Portunus trituberculatus]|uniref:Uncharacterized protein n=1 Tax=Portunus trituberculatus TaxID=210409 RepID=A0A5B7E8K6_PORTR|nr:hypothetical protein [Portunus trituberculatus]
MPNINSVGTTRNVHIFTPTILKLDSVKENLPDRSHHATHTSPAPTAYSHHSPPPHTKQKIEHVGTRIYQRCSKTSRTYAVPVNTELSDRQLARRPTPTKRGDVTRNVTHKENQSTGRYLL